MRISTLVDVVDGRFVVVAGDTVGSGVANTTDGSNVGLAALESGFDVLTGGLRLADGATMRTGLRVTGVRVGVRTVVGARMGARTLPGRRGEALGVCTSIGALTGLLARRTGAGAIMAIVGRRTNVEDVGIGTSTDIVGAVGRRRCGLKVTEIAVDGDRTGSVDGTEPTFCSLNDGAIVTIWLDGEGVGVLVGNKDGFVNVIDVGIISGDDLVGGLVLMTLAIGAGWCISVSFPKTLPVV